MPNLLLCKIFECSKTAIQGYSKYTEQLAITEKYKSDQSPYYYYYIINHLTCIKNFIEQVLNVPENISRLILKSCPEKFNICHSFSCLNYKHLNLTSTNLNMASIELKKILAGLTIAGLIGTSGVALTGCTRSGSG